jgi:hypothetical protein
MPFFEHPVFLAGNDCRKQQAAHSHSIVNHNKFQNFVGLLYATMDDAPGSSNIIHTVSFTVNQSRHLHVSE